TEQKISKKTYPRMIGDITFDAEQDDPTFELCSGDSLAIQYYAFDEKPYKGEKIAIERRFEEQYDASRVAQESGWIRIRFLVNCKGEAGRFRVVGMDENYEAKVFDSNITRQLLEITQSLDQWKGFESETRPFDYYNYLTFRIINGTIKEILP
ncbi:MAG: hypothetical protein AAF806_32435, partial [Bacteroidota bacterium]